MNESPARNRAPLDDRGGDKRLDFEHIEARKKRPNTKGSHRTHSDRQPIVRTQSRAVSLEHTSAPQPMPSLPRYAIAPARCRAVPASAMATILQSAGFTCLPRHGDASSCYILSYDNSSSLCLCSQARRWHFLISRRRGRSLRHYSEFFSCLVRGSSPPAGYSSTDRGTNNASQHSRAMRNSSLPGATLEQTSSGTLPRMG